MKMQRIAKVLVEFFKEEFANDPAGVAGWLAAGGDDLEEFMASFPKFERFCSEHDK